MYPLAIVPDLFDYFVVCFVDDDGVTCIPFNSHDHTSKELADKEAKEFTKRKGVKHFAAKMSDLITEL